MLIFDFGERIHVMLDVFSCKNEEFEIQSASYELSYGAGGVEETGVCSIYEHKIDTVVEPKQRGKYTLKITYHILDETLIELIGITVM